MAAEVQCLGKFEIVRKIGHGGMGSVSLARDTLLGREVALKTLLPDRADPEDALRRFRQEAKAVARLQHPNLVTVFEFGEVDGVCFLAMEYVDGRDLEELFAHQSLGIQEVGAILALVLDGLEEAHRRQVIHRDVKPSNIRVFSDRGRLSAKLLDFGLARIAQEGAISHSGTLVGTPYYMAPELLKGGQPDAWTDLWSVAVIFLQCLLGRRPFEAPTPAGIYFKIVFDSERTVLDGLPSVHERYLPFLAKAMNPEPSHRFRSAGEMAAALRELLELPADGFPAPEWLGLPGRALHDDNPTLGLDTAGPGGPTGPGAAPVREPAAPLPALAELHRQAAAGSAQAQNALGLRYLAGDGVFQNLLAADQFFRRAAEAGEAAAMVNLAGLLGRQGGAANAAEAETWLRKAVLLGSIEAQSRLGCVLMETGNPDRQAEAMAHLRAAARSGFPEAASALVAMAYREPALDQDPDFESWLAQAEQCSLPEALVVRARWLQRAGRGEEGAALLERAWDLGLHAAAFACARLHQELGHFPRAKEWFAKAHWRNHPGAAMALAKLILDEGLPGAEANAAQALREPASMGDPEAMFLRGELLLRNPAVSHQWADARNLITQAAGLDHAPALLFLARERRDHPDGLEEALELYRKAADAGLPEAQFELGLLLLQGHAGAVNPRQARDLILRAAQAGVPGAQHAQWELLVKSGLEPRAPSALAWLRQAAQARHPDSLYHLGRLLAEGTAVERKEAVALLRQAALAGQTQAGPPLKKLLDQGVCTGADLAGLDLAPGHALGRAMNKLKTRFWGG